MNKEGVVDITEVVAVVGEDVLEGVRFEDFEEKTRQDPAEGRAHGEP